MQTENREIYTDGAVVSPALVSVEYLKAGADASNAYVWAGVRKGKIPAPVLRAPRFTRWRKSDVDAWLADPAGWVAAHAPEAA